MSYQVGIDLGTTYTAAAVHRDGRAAIFSLGGRAASIPSVVLLREDETILTGEAAVRRAITEPERVAREFKRRLGDTTPIIVGGSPYSAEALMARLLRTVLAEIIAREGEEPTRIAVSHPANWGPYKHDLFAQAIRLAGINPGQVVTLTEPEAAAISYANQERVEEGQIVAVYDLGGGTFDACVLRRTQEGFEIIGTPEGIERLGGIDFDAAVFAHVARALDGGLENLDDRDITTVAAVSRLRADCVDAKEALSADTDATIPILLPNLQTEVRLTRREFESLIRPALADSIEAMRRAVASAGIGLEQVSKILLVGGSSRIPLVAQMVSSELGRPVAVDAHPKHAIAIGAAYVAAADVGKAQGPTGQAAAPVPIALGEPVPPSPPASVGPPTVAPPVSPTRALSAPPLSAPAPVEPASASPPAAPTPAPPSIDRDRPEPLGVPAHLGVPPTAAASPPPAGSPPGSVPAGPPAEPAGPLPAGSPPASVPSPPSEPSSVVTVESAVSGAEGAKPTPNRLPVLLGIAAVAVLAVIGGILALTRGGGGDDVAGDDDGIAAGDGDTDAEAGGPAGDTEDDGGAGGESTTTSSGPTSTEPAFDDAATQVEVNVLAAGLAVPDLTVLIRQGVASVSGTLGRSVNDELMAGLEDIDGVASIDAAALTVVEDDEWCSPRIKSEPRWACITEATWDGSRVHLVYDTYDSGHTFATGADGRPATFHYHFFPNSLPPENAGFIAAGAESQGPIEGGSWEVHDDYNGFTSPPFDAMPEKYCVRIGNASHAIESLASGNCWPVDDGS